MATTEVEFAFPPWLVQLVSLFPKQSCTSTKGEVVDWDQATLQYYPPGSGIPPHIDSHSPFHEPLATFSLGSGLNMDLRKAGQREINKLGQPYRAQAVQSSGERSLGEIKNQVSGSQVSFEDVVLKRESAVYDADAEGQDFCSQRSMKDQSRLEGTGRISENDHRTHHVPFSSGQMRSRTEVQSSGRQVESETYQDDFIYQGETFSDQVCDKPSQKSGLQSDTLIQEYPSAIEREDPSTNALHGGEQVSLISDSSPQDQSYNSSHSPTASQNHKKPSFTQTQHNSTQDSNHTINNPQRDQILIQPSDPLPHEHPSQSIWLLSKSLMVFKQESRYMYTHAIVARKSDPAPNFLKPQRDWPAQRQGRWSITFRRTRDPSTQPCLCTQVCPDAEIFCDQKWRRENLVKATSHSG